LIFVVSVLFIGFSRIFEMLTLNAIVELCEITTRDSAGRHFTQFSSHWELLEKMGFLCVHRPVHQATGLHYGDDHYSVTVTDSGLELIEAYTDSSSGSLQAYLEVLGVDHDVAGDLMDYYSNRFIRPASAAERQTSVSAGPEGVFDLDGKSVFVQD
jgi:hypothetical protein